jgi:hypothetical protein
MSSTLLEQVCLRSSIHDADVVCACYVAFQRALMFAYGYSIFIVMGVTVALREWSLAGYKQTISPLSRVAD